MVRKHNLNQCQQVCPKLITSSEKIECFKYMKTVKRLTHKNIWSQHSLEHHLYFNVWASMCIHFVFFGFGGVFLVCWGFFKLTFYGKRAHIKLIRMHQCTIPPLQDFCSLAQFFTLEAGSTIFLTIYQNVSRILEQFFLVFSSDICNMHITVKSDR